MFPNPFTKKMYKFACFDGFVEGRPTRKILEEVFGFPPPQPLVEAIQIVFDLSGGDPFDAGALCREVLGFSPRGLDGRRPAMPPEFFPIGNIGSDGVHLGYLIRTPEIAQDEYQFGLFSPADSDALWIYMHDTRSGLLNEMALCMQNAKPEDAAAIHAVCRKMGWTLPPEPTAKSGSLPPIIPEGWRYLPSGDGVGVLAPEDKFLPESPKPFARPEWIQKQLRPDDKTEYSSNPPPSPSVLYEAADHALAKGCPATALWYLRECLEHHWHEKQYVTALTRMAIVYTKLGRPKLASHARYMIRKFGKMIEK